MRIAVLGYIVRGPIGGLAWHHLQYVIGLHRLGHDVLFVEDSDEYPACYHPASSAIDTDPSDGLRFAEHVFQRIGLPRHWTYYDAHTARWHGPQAASAAAWCREADVVLNVSGFNPLRDWLAHVPVRALIDTDPAFTQIRHLTNQDASRRAGQHTHFFTFGENIGGPDCLIPDDGFDWIPTRQPVVLDLWPVRPASPDGSFTTVMQWESYAAREYGGRSYGMKSSSFTPYLDLPKRTAHRLTLALGSATAPRALLREHGWDVIDPLVVSADPWEYQRFIQSSKAEFSIAKNGYVVSRSGWFSERTAAYLASGRPVVIQDTGFSTLLPVGHGVLPFSTPAEALSGLDAVSGNYAVHCRAARDLAEEFFSADRVLNRLIENLEHPGSEGVVEHNTAGTRSGVG